MTTPEPKIHFSYKSGRTFCGVSWARNLTTKDIGEVDCKNCLRIAKAQEKRVKRKESKP